MCFAMMRLPLLVIQTRALATATLWGPSLVLRPLASVLREEAIFLPLTNTQLMPRCSSTLFIYIYIYLRVCLSGMHAAGLQFRLSTCCYASEVPSPVLLVGSELQEYWFRGLISTNRVVQPRKELCRVKSGRVCRKRESE